MHGAWGWESRRQGLGGSGGSALARFRKACSRHLWECSGKGAAPAKKMCSDFTAGSDLDGDGRRPARAPRGFQAGIGHSPCMCRACPRTPTHVPGTEEFTYQTTGHLLLPDSGGEWVRLVCGQGYWTCHEPGKTLWICRRRPSSREQDGHSRSRREGVANRPG